jgi:hypothetical protein
MMMMIGYHYHELLELIKIIHLCIGNDVKNTICVKIQSCFNGQIGDIYVYIGITMS